MTKLGDYTPADRVRAAAIRETEPPAEIDPRVDALVADMIGRVADKWSMVILEVLEEHGELRFTRLGEKVAGISQKMLTQTLRRMERDGLIVRTVHPVIPPRVEYRLTDLGRSLGRAFCGVWIWAEDHLGTIEAARRDFDARQDGQASRSVA
ncbi:winged helix-turn-helix transcriptional regulator [Pacificimonas flava]|uniref:Transcriptional regulator, HxlR family n=1 Tax=Pacificimonas flava TaxID=1234595 RepID=M2T8B9_9SPHN|nr:helix-turn-helix domain-containing protein [Pacificimonas flava]EMD82764.1 Transcriptional regulator, HxlR family [Pacificimonas flava]MBB5279382.1 DNA-binding HxlR family transcriptional regulator [Pacificimonas flava]